MENVTYSEYWQQINSMAEDIIEEAKEYGQDLYDVVHETVDGHQWVIYYSCNDDVLRHAGNSDAWEEFYSPEDIGRLVADQGMDGARAAQAFFAMLQDVHETIHDLLSYRTFTAKCVGYIDW